VFARLPRVSISLARLSPAPISVSKMPMMQPSSASRRAIAAPMPLAPPVTSTARFFNPRILAPRSCGLRPAVIGRAACQHAGRFVGHHDLVLLILHVDARRDDAAIALRGRAHRSDLDFAMHGIADANRRENLLLELEHGETRSLNHALAQQPLDQTIDQSGRHELSLDRAL